MAQSRNKITLPVREEAIMTLWGTFPGIPEPVLKELEPVPEKSEPVMEHLEPVPEKSEPVMKHLEPVPEESEPVLKYLEPVMEHLEPVLIISGTFPTYTDKYLLYKILK